MYDSVCHLIFVIKSVLFVRKEATRVAVHYKPAGSQVYQGSRKKTDKRRGLFRLVSAVSRDMLSV